MVGGKLTELFSRGLVLMDYLTLISDGVFIGPLGKAAGTHTMFSNF
jgi:hypothetical protein